MTTSQATPATRLMISAALPPDWAGSASELQRGMTVLDAAGECVGSVAAVLVEDESERAIYLVVSHGVAAGDYRLAAVAQVASVEPEAIRLRLTAAELESLPHHETD